MSYRFISDSGHAWLEVPVIECIKLGVMVDEFCYYDPKKQLAYLEEDCIAPRFFEAFEKCHGCAPEFEEHRFEGDAFVRGLPQFTRRQ